MYDSFKTLALKKNSLLSSSVVLDGWPLIMRNSKGHPSKNRSFKDLKKQQLLKHHLCSLNHLRNKITYAALSSWKTFCSMQEINTSQAAGRKIIIFDLNLPRL